MRHIFKCAKCGTDFEKVDAGVLCADCVEKEAVAVEPEPAPIKEPSAKTPGPKKATIPKKAKGK